MKAKVKAKVMERVVGVRTQEEWTVEGIQEVKALEAAEVLNREGGWL